MENNSNTVLQKYAVRKKFLRNLVVYSLLLLITGPVLYFFYYLISQSLTSADGGLTFTNWSFLWTTLNKGVIIIPTIWPILWFTIRFALLVTVCDLVIVVPAAYAFSRLNFPAKKFWMKVLFFLNAFPGSTIMIAIFFLLVKMGLINTMIGVVLVKVTMSAPGHVYMLKGFFDDIPWDYEWAALVDGCSRFQSFLQVVLPSASNGIGVIAIFAFLSGYSEWFLFQILLYNVKYTTLAKILQTLIMDGGTKISDIGTLSAMAVFFALPVAIFYLFSQNQLMKIRNIGGKKLV